MILAITFWARALLTEDGQAKSWIGNVTCFLILATYLGSLVSVVGISDRKEEQLGRAMEQQAASVSPQAKTSDTYPINPYHARQFLKGKDQYVFSLLPGKVSIVAVEQRSGIFRERAVFVKTPRTTYKCDPERCMEAAMPHVIRALAQQEGSPAQKAALLARMQDLGSGDA